MRIEHIALWSDDIETMKCFYEKYFGVTSSDIYINIKKGFKSYFLNFEDGARLEIMNKNDLAVINLDVSQIGYCHLAVSVGTIFNVIKLTKTLKEDGFTVLSEPRTTGDGYFESVVLDPDNNRIEITQ